MKKSTFIAIGIVLIVAGVAYVLVMTAPQVTLTPRSFMIKQYSDEAALVLGKREYVLATIDLSNASNRTITYSGYGRENPLFSVLLEAPTGWRARSQGWVCGTGLREISLAPNSGVTFHAVVERAEPCKLSLAYSDGRKPSRFWQRIPDWLRQRVPWGRDYHTADSSTIDLRKAVNLPVEIEESSYEPLEEAVDVLQATEKGDIDARFRLAGRYWTGDGVEKSASEALRWYESAATNGHAEAAYNLGTLYEYGLGTAPDRMSAVGWYRRASERGHATAKERLQALASAAAASP